MDLHLGCYINTYIIFYKFFIIIIENYCKIFIPFFCLMKHAAFLLIASALFVDQAFNAETFNVGLMQLTDIGELDN